VTRAKKLTKNNEGAKKLFLFDFDGVVVDSLELYETAVNLCLKKIGMPPLKSRSDFLDLFDQNFYEGIARRGVDIEAFTGVSAEIAPELNYAGVLVHSRLIGILDALKRRHLLSLISSNSVHAIRFIYREIDRYFEHILGYEFMFSKIDKIRHEMERTGIAGDRTFYIGDTLGDIHEAKEAGVRTVAVTWGWHSRERLASSSPDYLIDTPEELLRL
jgi:phosphoglycolate phosphatase